MLRDLSELAEDWKQQKQDFHIYVNALREKNKEKDLQVSFFIAQSAQRNPGSINSFYQKSTENIPL